MKKNVFTFTSLFQVYYILLFFFNVSEENLEKAIVSLNKISSSVNFLTNFVCFYYS